MVKVMLDKWAIIDKMKKQREANEAKAAERKERQERTAHEARMRWNAEMQRQEQILDTAYANGLVKTAKPPQDQDSGAAEVPRNTEKLSANEAMAILKERKLNNANPSLMNNISQHKQTRQPAVNKPKIPGLGLGLSAYGGAEIGEEVQHGLVAYEDSEGEEGDPIIVD